MSKNVCRGEEGYMEWHGKVANALDELDSLGGVLVTVSAGNDGREKPPGHTDEYMPNILSARHGSPLIITGAVNNYGQLAKLSSPGTGKVPVTCYAVYVSVFCFVGFWSSVYAIMDCPCRGMRLVSRTCCSRKTEPGLAITPRCLDAIDRKVRTD